MLNSVTIRKANLQDLPRITELSAALIRSDAAYDPVLREEWSASVDGQTYLKKRITGRNGLCLIAEHQHKIVGYLTGAIVPIQLWRPVKRSEIDNLFILDTHRGLGVGRLLINQFTTWSTNRNVERILLYAESRNHRAISFYERNSFTQEHIVLEKIV